MFWKLWRGRYSLAVAFWVFYALGYLISVGLVTLISPLIVAYPWRPIAVAALILPYNAVATVGVWRSADAHPDQRNWPAFAKIAVFCWEALVILSFARGTARLIGAMSN
jgi:hypothetical protein